MSVVSNLKTFLQTYAGFVGPTWVNNLDSKTEEYSIIPLPGPRTVSTDIVGNKTREYPFAIQSVKSTAAELERLETIGFFEAFSDWLDTQTDTGVLPNLGTGKEAESITAINWAFLYQQGESQTGIYQVQCILTYIQRP